MTRGNLAMLVVDDEVDTCQNLSDIFGDLGYRVDLAHNGYDALKLVQQHAYDVALLDMKMPGMDGLTLYRRIKKLSAGTVSLLISAFTTTETANEALAAGVLHVLSKPVDFPKLLSHIRESLDRPLTLLVDDDEDLCDSLWDLLHERGFRTCVAHDENEAAERLRDRDYQVVVIDMKLPRGTGHGVFQQVRQTNPKAHTILITGFRSETALLVQQVVAEGVDAVCYKPFDLPAFLSTIERLSAQKALN